MFLNSVPLTGSPFKLIRSTHIYVATGNMWRDVYRKDVFVPNQEK